MLHVMLAQGADAGSGMGMVVVSALIGLVVGTLVWGVMLKFLIPAIGKQAIDWGGAFKTALVVNVINAVIGIVLGLIPLGAILSLPASFLVAMFVIDKMRGLGLGKSALVTLVCWLVMVVIGLVLGVVVVAIAAAAGMAAGGGGA